MLQAATFQQFFFKCTDRGENNALHREQSGCCNIVGTIIYKEALVRRRLAFCKRPSVYLRFRFAAALFMGKYESIKGV